MDAGVAWVCVPIDRHRCVQSPGRQVLPILSAVGGGRLSLSLPMLPAADGCTVYTTPIKRLRSVECPGLPVLSAIDGDVCAPACYRQSFPTLPALDGCTVSTTRHKVVCKPAMGVPSPASEAIPCASMKRKRMTVDTDTTPTAGLRHWRTELQCDIPMIGSKYGYDLISVPEGWLDASCARQTLQCCGLLTPAVGGGTEALELSGTLFVFGNLRRMWQSDRCMFGAGRWWRFISRPSC